MEKIILLKLITGEELIGVSESDLNDDVINIDNPAIIIQGLNQNAEYSFKLLRFMPYTTDSLFSFSKKHIILICEPESSIIEYYKDFEKERIKSLEEFQDRIRKLVGVSSSTKH